VGGRLEDLGFSAAVIKPLYAVAGER